MWWTSVSEVLVEEAKAALEVAQAQHEESKAEIEATQARYDEAIRDLEVKSTLARGGGGSQRDAERSRAAAATLAAELSSAKARERVRSASVIAARAALDRAEIDLKRTIIRSPIDGVVVGRSVELGQNVKIEGSNDGVNYATLADPQGNALDIAALKIEQILEVTRYIRPRVTAGDGTTSLTVTMILGRM